MVFKPFVNMDNWEKGPVVLGAVYTGELARF